MQSVEKNSPRVDHAPTAENLSAKWFVSIDDLRIPLPRRKVPVSLIRHQAGVPADRVLVRDHNAPDDEVLSDEAEFDCAVGNVIYTLPRCEAPAPAQSRGPAKLAFSVDDRVEETTNGGQTATTILDLFGLDRGKKLFRDYESPNDEFLKADDPVRFEDGPVFYTRGHDAGAKLTIFVNKRPFTKDEGVKHQMKPREIAALITNSPDDFDTYAGDAVKGQPLPPNEEIKIHDQDHFTVVKKVVEGGYAADRVEHELTKLRSGGAKIEKYDSPAAVLYRGLPVREGLGIERSDVLVSIPSGYPGQHLDGAYLPVGSPLLGRVVGQPQGSVLSVGGVSFQLVSYHPHTGGGFPAWNPNLHGFHTYIDALIAWLARWR